MNTFNRGDWRKNFKTFNASVSTNLALGVSNIPMVRYRGRPNPSQSPSGCRGVPFTPMEMAHGAYISAVLKRIWGILGQLALKEESGGQISRAHHNELCSDTDFSSHIVLELCYSIHNSAAVASITEYTHLEQTTLVVHSVSMV